jgi:hypothetical protein
MVLLAALAAGAQAAPPSHNILSDPKLFADAHLRGLDAEMHLSDKQKEQLRPLFYAEGQKLVAILNDPSLREDQRQRMIEQLHDETAAKVFSMLTPAQRRSQPPPANPRPPSPQPPPARI